MASITEAVKAFDSVAADWRPRHVTITDEAAANVGLGFATASRIATEVIKVDTTDITYVWRQGLRPTAAYSKSHHYDRPKLDTDADAFRAGSDFVSDITDDAIAAIVSTENEQAFIYLGYAMHAIQDLLSHSNLANMTAAEREMVWDAIWDDTKPLPTTPLKLTGYDPSGVDLKGKPSLDHYAIDATTLDAYSHREHAKDTPAANADATSIIPDTGGTTAHQVAYEVAVDFSTRLLNIVKDSSGEGGWASFRTFPVAEPSALDRGFHWGRDAESCIGGECLLDFDGTSVTLPQSMLNPDAINDVYRVALNQFFMDHDITAPNGERMNIILLFQTLATTFPTAGHAEIAFDRSELDTDSSTVGVFFRDESTVLWSPVSGTQIVQNPQFPGNPNARLAVFDFLAGGFYGVGGIPVPEPTSILLVFAAATCLSRRMFRPLFFTSTHRIPRKCATNFRRTGSY
jgi:hypothetical protein